MPLQGVWKWNLVFVDTFLASSHRNQQLISHAMSDVYLAAAVVLCNSRYWSFSWTLLHPQFLKGYLLLNPSSALCSSLSTVKVQGGFE